MPSEGTHPEPAAAEQGSGSRFASDTAVAMQSLRRAILILMTEAGADPSQPQEVSRRFGLDKTLTWKIARIIREEDVAAATLHVPGSKRIGSLIAAMEKSGASPAAADAVRRAYDAFNRLIADHSGDRHTLDAMVLAGTRNGASAKRQELFRKGGFQCNASIWGVRAKLQLGVHIVAPIGDDGYLQQVTLCGFHGLQRLRPNLPWGVARAWTIDVGPAPRPAPIPLEPAGMIYGGPLLPGFCSEPLPRLRMGGAEGGDRRFDLVEGEVGQRSAVDLFMGWRWPANVSMRASKPGEHGGHGMQLSTPVETAVMDVWLHRSMEFAHNPLIRVYGMLPSDPPAMQEGPDAGVLPIPDAVIPLGVGRDGVSIAEWPRLGELLRHGADRMGWALQDFVGFRYKVKYPPIPSLAMLQYPLLPGR